MTARSAGQASFDSKLGLLNRADHRLDHHSTAMTATTNGHGPHGADMAKVSNNGGRLLPRCEVGIAQTSVKSEVILYSSLDRRCLLWTSISLLKAAADLNEASVRVTCATLVAKAERCAGHGVRSCTQ